MQRLTFYLSKRIYGFSLLDWIGLFIISSILVAPASFNYIKRETVHYIEIVIESSHKGNSTLHYDTGRGFSELPPITKFVYENEPGRTYRFIVPEKQIIGLRLQLNQATVRARISSPSVVSKGNVVFKKLNINDFIAESGVKESSHTSDALVIETIPGTAPVLQLRLDPPVNINKPSILSLAFGISIRFLIALLGIICALYLYRFIISMQPLVKLRRFVGYTTSSLRVRPSLAIAVISLVAVIINCYPIVFLGRSFVSPNYGTALLYERAGTLPGDKDMVIENGRGSDVGAMIWYGVPVSMVQHRALFEDGELPLWNRYNSAGSELLSQGQSMFGDPIHMLVIAANGAAWAWDLKFLIAKWMLALSLGLIVFHGTRHLPSAALTALSAPFIGIFLYRLNHPAFFSFCYAPLILYCWCRLSSATTWRARVICCAGLLASCWTEINSGTVKEAYMLLIFMNFSGLVVLVLADISGREKTIKCLLAVATGVAFTLISAPVWLTFLDSLRASFTLSVNPQAFQIHPVILLGLFDEIFYRPLVNPEGVFNPSANFLVLIGVLYAFATFRRTSINRLKIALVIGAFAPLAFTFGIIPPGWIVQIPFIANIVHVSDVFSPILIIHLIVLAGFGFHAATIRLGTPEGRGDLIIAGLLLGAIVFPYIALTHNAEHSAFPTIYFATRMPVSGFVWGSLIILPSASIILALLTRRTLIHGKWSEIRAILAVLCLVALLGRQGPHARIGFDNYLFHPAARVDFHSTSPVVETMRQKHDTPFRSTGFEGILFPGWSGVYGIEGICGPEALINPFYRELLEGCGFDRPWEWRYAVHVNTIGILKPVYDFLNIRYYLGLHRDRDQINPNLRTEKSNNLDEVFVSDTVWPRAFFTDRLAVYDSPAAMGKLVREGDGRPFAAIQSPDLPKESKLPHDLVNRTITPASNYRLTSNTTSFEVVANGPGVIVLQESWIKDGFRVVVNGRPAKYHRINHGFKGVEIDAAGTYQVNFSYWPHHFTLALTLAALGTLLFVAGAFWLWRMDDEVIHVQNPA